MTRPLYSRASAVTSSSYESGFSISVASTQSAAPGPVVPVPIVARAVPRSTAPAWPPGRRPSCSIVAMVPMLA